MDTRYILKLTEFHNLQLYKAIILTFIRASNLPWVGFVHLVSMMLLKANIRIGSITTYDKLMWITVLAVVFMSASVQQIVNVFVCSIIDLPVNAQRRRL